MAPRTNHGNGSIHSISGVKKAALPYIKNIQMDVVDVALKSRRKSEPAPVHSTSMHHPIKPKIKNLVSMDIALPKGAINMLAFAGGAFVVRMQ